MLLYDDISLLIIIIIINTLVAVLPTLPMMISRLRACKSTSLPSYPYSILGFLDAYLPSTHHLPTQLLK